MEPDESQRPDQWLAPTGSESAGYGSDRSANAVSDATLPSTPALPTFAPLPPMSSGQTPATGGQKSPTAGSPVSPTGPPTPAVFPNAPHLVPKRRDGVVVGPPAAASPAYGLGSQPPSVELAPYGAQTVGIGPNAALEAGAEPEPEPPAWPWPSLAPGIIELRPLKPAEIVFAAFRALRYNAGTMLIVSTGAILVQTVLLNFLDFGSYFTMTRTGLSFNPTAIVGTLIEVIVSTVLAAGIGFAVWHAARGKKPKAGATWRAINARIPSITGVGALTTVVVVPIMLGIVLGASLVVGGHDAGNTMALIEGVVVIAAMGGGALAILTRIAVAPIVALLENATPMQALNRAVRMVRPRFWPTLGTLALAFVPAIVVAAVIGYIPQIFEASAQLSAIVTLAAVVVFQPYFAAVVALIYIDLRIRNENLPYRHDFVRGHL